MCESLPEPMDNVAGEAACRVPCEVRRSGNPTYASMVPSSGVEEADMLTFVHKFTNFRPRKKTYCLVGRKSKTSHEHVVNAMYGKEEK